MLTSSCVCVLNQIGQHVLPKGICKNLKGKHWHWTTVLGEPFRFASLGAKLQQETEVMEFAIEQPIQFPLRAGFAF